MHLIKETNVGLKVHNGAMRFQHLAHCRIKPFHHIVLGHNKPFLQILDPGLQARHPGLQGGNPGGQAQEGKATSHYGERAGGEAGKAWAIL